MYGVVLWRDLQKKCAVIWCEDHRNLAYFREDVGAAEPSLTFGPGDLVEFEVREENDMRLALAPSVVAERHYPNLPEELMRATPPSEQGGSTETSLPGREQGAARVLPFSEFADKVHGANSGPMDSWKYG